MIMRIGVETGDIVELVSLKNYVMLYSRHVYTAGSMYYDVSAMFPQRAK